MSNLSLSFSFYFWWINSSRSVTLTNSLSQTVSVMPDVTFFWIANNVKNLTAMAYAHDSFGTISAPQVSYVGNELVAHLTPSSVGRYMGGSLISDEVDLSTCTKLKIECSATTGNGNYSQIRGSIITEIAQPLILKDMETIVDRYLNVNSFTGIKELTLTESTARACITFCDAADNQAVSNIHIKRIWAE